MKLSLLLLAFTLHAAEVRLDPARTEVHYTLGTTLHTVHGTFKMTRGDFSFDPATGKASGALVVSAASGESGNESRDKRMHESILESGKYPEIVFRPDRIDGKVEPAGHSDLKLHGMFNLHGADHEMIVPLSVDAADGTYTATATFEIPYIKWGLKNPSTFILRVNDKVQLTVKTVAR
jgi:polyisoprenoid-binding protein YceI